MKNVIALGLSVAVSLAAVASYAIPYSLGTIHLKSGGNDSIKLSDLQDKFIYTVTCTLHNPDDEHAAIKVSQKFNDFDTVTLENTNIHKNRGRETVQGQVKIGDSTLVINKVNDKSGPFKKDYLTFERSVSGSTNDIDISCTAGALDNPLPPAPPVGG